MNSFGKALTKGLDILEALQAAEEPQAFAELGRSVDVSSASFARFLKILVARGYVSQDESGRYRLGIRAAGLGLKALSASPLHEVARPHLDEIAAAAGESSELAVFEKGNCESDRFVFLERVECPRSVVLKARPGSSFEIRGTTAVGDLATAFGWGPSRGLDGARASRIKSEGFCEKLQNNDECYRAAAPLFDRDGECIGALVVAAPAFRVGGREKRAIRKLLTEQAEAVSAKLGAAVAAGGV